MKTNKQTLKPLHNNKKNLKFLEAENKKHQRLRGRSDNGDEMIPLTSVKKTNKIIRIIYIHIYKPKIATTSFHR